MARAGGQPFDTLASYKLAQFANGDFAGVSAITTFTPNIKTNLGLRIIEDQLRAPTAATPRSRPGAVRTTRSSSARVHPDQGSGHQAPVQLDSR